MREQVWTRCLTFLVGGSESELTTCLFELLTSELQRLLFSSRNDRWDLSCLFKHLFSLMSGRRTFPYISNQWHSSCFRLTTAETRLDLTEEFLIISAAFKKKSRLSIRNISAHSNKSFHWNGECAFDDGSSRWAATQSARGANNRSQTDNLKPCHVLFTNLTGFCR